MMKKYFQQKHSPMVLWLSHCLHNPNPVMALLMLRSKHCLLSTMQSWHSSGRKKQAYTKPSFAPTPCAGSIELRDSVDGSIALQPIKYEGHCKDNVKEEPLGEQNAAAEKEPIPASLPWGQNVVAKAEPSPAIFPGCGDGRRLDPIAAAAVNALKTRNCQKKVAAKVAKKPAAAVAKRPAHAVKRIKTKTEIEEVTPSNIKYSMPNVTGGKHQVQPVHYKGGVIYTVIKARKFRALRVRGDNYSEKACSFKVRSPKKAWSDAVSAIEEHHRS